MRITATVGKIDEEKCEARTQAGKVTVSHDSQRAGRLKISPLQQKHFKAMEPHELQAVILDANKQMDAIAFSTTKAADYKRAELEARKEFCAELLRNKTKERK